MVVQVVHFLLNRYGVTIGSLPARGPVLDGIAGSALFGLESILEDCNNSQQQGLIGSAGEVWTNK